MLLDKGILVFLPELHDVGHVQLVEGGQHGIRILRLLQARRNLQPHPVHFHPAAGERWDKNTGAGEGMKWMLDSATEPEP